jgi:hypothetical protein
MLTHQSQHETIKLYILLLKFCRQNGKPKYFSCFIFFDSRKRVFCAKRRYFRILHLDEYCGIWNGTDTTHVIYICSDIVVRMVK